MMRLLKTSSNQIRYALPSRYIHSEVKNTVAETHATSAHASSHHRRRMRHRNHNRNSDNSIPMNCGTLVATTDQSQSEIISEKNEAGTSYFLISGLRELERHATRSVNVQSASSQLYSLTIDSWMPSYRNPGKKKIDMPRRENTPAGRHIDYLLVLNVDATFPRQRRSVAP